MKVTEVVYEKCHNTGNFSHDIYRVVIQLEEGEKAEDAFNNAKKLVERQINCPSAKERETAESVKKFDDEDMPF